jgi:hypothetical protein
LQEIKRKGVEVASNVITFKPRFVKIGHLLQNLKGEDNDKEKQDGNIISPIFLRK